MEVIFNVRTQPQCVGCLSSALLMDNKYVLGPPVVFFLQYAVDDVVDVVAEDCIAEIRRDGVGAAHIGYPGDAERVRPVTGRRRKEVVRTKAGFRNSQRAG